MPHPCRFTPTSDDPKFRFSPFAKSAMVIGFTWNDGKARPFLS